MKDLLKRVGRYVAGFVEELLRDLTYYSAEREAAAMSYARQRDAMLHGVVDPALERRTMSLYAGGVHQVNVLGLLLWQCHIYNTASTDELRQYTVFGDTAAQASARARQLISALDGARLL